MTESLRERCIEAGVNVIETMALADVNTRSYKIQTMNLILDAVLDVLEESAEEWPCHDGLGPCPCVTPLLSVLRGNGE